MGYTHYYYTDKALDPDKFKAAVADFKKIMPILKHLGSPIAGWDGEGDPLITDTEISFNGVAHCGHSYKELGITWPADKSKGIRVGKAVVGAWFAGAKLQTRTCGGDCSHETFRIEQKVQSSRLDPHRADKKLFGCTKTAFKPYDLAVICCLIILKHHLVNQIMVHSDGTLENWRDGMELCQHFLGYGDDFKLDDDE